VDFAYSPDDVAMRHEVKAWLDEHLVGDVALLGQSTPFTPEDWKVRVAWEQELGRDGWVGLSWPEMFGGREATVTEELVFAQEYALADGPSVRASSRRACSGPRSSRSALRSSILRGAAQHHW